MKIKQKQTQAYLLKSGRFISLVFMYLNTMSFYNTNVWSTN